MGSSVTISLNIDKCHPKLTFLDLILLCVHVWHDLLGAHCIALISMLWLPFQFANVLWLRPRQDVSHHQYISTLLLFFFSQTCKRAVYHTLLLIQIMCAGTWELRLNIFVYELFRLSFVLVNVMAINCYFMEEGRSTSILSFLFVSKMSMHWFSLIPCVVLTVWHLVSYFLTSNCFWTTIMLKKFQTCM